MEATKDLCLACKQAISSEGKGSRRFEVLDEHGPTCCLLFRLILSIRNFVSFKSTEPLRSYAIQFLRPVAQNDLFDAADLMTSKQPIFTIRCPDNDVKFAMSNTPSKRTFPQPSMQAVGTPYDYSTNGSSPQNS
jgi:hypothetical protein